VTGANGALPKVGIRTGVRAHLASPLYRNAYFLIIGAGAGSLLGFVFWTLAARRYSAESVGLNSVLLSAMMLASGACQLGLNAVLFRYLPGAGRSTRALILRSYALTAALSILVGAGTALMTGLWAPDSSFLHGDVWWVFAFAVATASFTIYTLQDGVLTGLRQARWIPIEGTVFPATRIALLPVFAGLSERLGIFLAWTVPVLLSVAPVNVLILRRLVPRHVRYGSDIARERRQILRLAAGNYLGMLFQLASTMLMPIIVAAEVGTRITAYFYIPWTISTGVQLVAMNMTTSLTVEVAYDESKLSDYCRSVMVQTMRLVVPIAITLMVGASYILLVFGHAYSREGATCLRLLAIATIPNVVVALGIGVARIHHDGRMALLIPGIGSVVSIGLSLALLPRLGIDGAGWGWLVGQLIVAAWLLAGLLRPVFFGRRR
jgi:O-antigen/teichoic acid export membrane protein